MKRVGERMSPWSVPASTGSATEKLAPPFHSLDAATQEGCHGTTLTVGGTIVVPLSDYRPPQAGQPPVKKVSVRQRLPLQREPGAQCPTRKADENSVPNRQSIVKKSSVLRLATWNVRTMCPGLFDYQIDDSRKTAIINRELMRLNIDIAALQETRLPSNGSLREEDYTFFWQGNEPEEPRMHGVEYAVRNSLLSSVEPSPEGTSRILFLRLSTSSSPVNILSIYVPTLSSATETKDEFYEELETTISGIPATEQLYLLGDFNARVGADQESWPRSIGHFGIGKLNKNGQRLLEICSYHDLCVTNTFFATKPRHRVSWCHPRSRRWHQLDLIITRRLSLNSVLSPRSYHSADCDTDHSLVGSKVRLQPRRIYRSKQKGRPRINTARTVLPDLCKRFDDSVEEALRDCPTSSPVERWNYIRDAIYTSAMGTFGKRERHNPDWKARNDAQRTARRSANDYWLNLCEGIQLSADCGNIRAMYDGMKKAFGPSITKTAPLKTATGDIITDRGKQMERWAEHYKELYSRENVVSAAAIENTDTLSLMDELDTPPTIDELRKAINSLASGKAPGSDGIPPEVVKAGKNTALHHHLHELLLQCSEEGAAPQDMRNASIITLYKNKGDRSDCNNYRRISLLSIVGKAFARVVLNRLQKLAERVYPEAQCGFRAKRSTIDMVFSLRQLQEKCREQRRPLYVAFIDLTKAFELVSRQGMFTLLQRIGCPPKLLRMILSFHEDMYGTVQYDGSSSDPFPINNGVKQGCVLAPTLFGIFFSLLLTFAFHRSEDGVYLHTRSDGRLFNLARLRAKTKVRKVLIREMLFADDAALTAHTEPALQRLMDRFSHACNEFALTVSIKKTQVMVQDVCSIHRISIDDHILEVVGTFTYLGSTISSNLSLEAELNKRIGKAATVMARLGKRVWDNAMLTTNTKLVVYKACILSTLLYGSEAWTLYSHQERRLNAFHMRCLRRILGISWQDRVPNKDVLTQAGMTSMYALLSQRRLRWLGHVSRMDDGRIPKDVLYGELATGARPAGRPVLRYKYVLKRDMKAGGIDQTS
ncbi:PREDICTED: uncharacterized protein LOC109470795 [Branchiostoma belcheri]|uniref:Uncharacterized protein LOC109470795 n=1 Tax=Branchiostoma belcheri TaxID=7741 RepID=A0A6P4Z2Y5_BRABE|nr:PREDICTED: uncharacterized protein LOC109470795 [Branchiostoma belcheri]